MLAARFLSVRPRTTVFFLFGLGRFNSRKEMRVSEAMPSEMSLISPRACLLFLVHVNDSRTSPGECLVGMTTKRDILKWEEACNIDHFAKLSKVIDTLLDFLQAITHCVTLEGDLEQRVANRALEEKVIGHGVDAKAKSILK